MTAQQVHLPGKYQLRVEDYTCLADAGTFSDAKTELIEGDIIVVSPRHRPHAYLKTEIYDRLRDALRGAPSALRPLVEVSVALSPHDQPEPDIVVTSEPRGEGPVPLASVALVVEVADATLATDLGCKAALYARHGVPEYWVVGVEARVIHQLWRPDGGAYAACRDIAFGQSIATETIGGVIIDTRDLD